MSSDSLTEQELKAAHTSRSPEQHVRYAETLLNVQEIQQVKMAEHGVGTTSLDAQVFQVNLAHAEMHLKLAEAKMRLGNQPYRKE